MIVNNTNGRLEEILKFVHSRNDEQISQTFIRCMASLAMKADTGRVELYKDFARMSMSWTLFNQDGKAVMNGGFIFHPKPGENSPDNFSTHLDTRFYGYSIHT